MTQNCLKQPPPRLLILSLFLISLNVVRTASDLHIDKLYEIEAEASTNTIQVATRTQKSVVALLKDNTIVITSIANPSAPKKTKKITFSGVEYIPNPSLSCWQKTEKCVLALKKGAMVFTFDTNEIQLHAHYYSDSSDPKVLKTLVIEETDYFFTVEKTQIARWNSGSKENSHKAYRLSTELQAKQAIEVSLVHAPFTHNLLMFSGLVDKINSELIVLKIDDLSLTKALSLKTFSVSNSFLYDGRSLQVPGQSPVKHFSYICSLDGKCVKFDYISGHNVFIHVLDNSRVGTVAIAMVEEAESFVAIKGTRDLQFFAPGFEAFPTTNYTIPDSFGSQLLDVQSSRFWADFILVTEKSVSLVSRDYVAGESVAKFCHPHCLESKKCTKKSDRKYCGECKTGFLSTDLGCTRSQAAAGVAGGYLGSAADFNFDETGKVEVKRPYDPEPTPEQPEQPQPSSNPNPAPSTPPNPTQTEPTPKPAEKPEETEDEKDEEAKPTNPTPEPPKQPEEPTVTPPKNPGQNTETKPPVTTTPPKSPEDGESEDGNTGGGLKSKIPNPLQDTTSQVILGILFLLVLGLAITLGVMNHKKYKKKPKRVRRPPQLPQTADPTKHQYSASRYEDFEYNNNKANQEHSKPPVEDPEEPDTPKNFDTPSEYKTAQNSNKGHRNNSFGYNTGTVSPPKFQKVRSNKRKVTDKLPDINEKKGQRSFKRNRKVDYFTQTQQGRRKSRLSISEYTSTEKNFNSRVEGSYDYEYSNNKVAGLGATPSEATTKKIDFLKVDRSLGPYDDMRDSKQRLNVSGNRDSDYGDNYDKEEEDGAKNEDFEEIMFEDEIDIFDENFESSERKKGVVGVGNLDVVMKKREDEQFSIQQQRVKMMQRYEDDVGDFEDDSFEF